VITSREDPNLPLARLRVRGLLTELRAADLRFTVAETAVFLQKVMGLNLTETQIAALEARTEGWVAGLQMAALSMRGQEDVSGFIQSFTGSHRFVLDYLLEEVLHQQPEHVQTFLLKTAVLNQLTGPLCNALTGDDNGQRFWNRWTAPTCSSCRWTTSGAGIAIIISLPICCGSDWLRSNQIWERHYTSVRAIGMQQTAVLMMPFAMR
jgi:ATP/maltotriose-dependent transcriptional regulator MalT